jgi:hypothetical protein
MTTGFSLTRAVYAMGLQKSVEVVERKLCIEGRRHELEHIVY